MTDSAETSAFRSSLVKVLGGPRSTPANESRSWVEDWPALVELGVMSILDPDLDAGLESVHLAVAVSEELSRALHPLPGHAMVPAGALRPALDAVLPEGLDQNAVAFVCAQADLELDRESGISGLVTGSTRPVAGLAGLTHLLVPFADVEDAVLLVDVAAPGVLTTELGSLDVSRTFSTVTFEQVAARIIAHGEGRRLALLSRLLLVADTTASTQLSVQRTVEYARERTAFGHAIGRYQAVQHRLVEHAIAVRQMADLAGAAAEAWVLGEEVDARLAVAEVYSAEKAQEIISDCIQLTGAIGFTWEYGLHFALRRVAGNAQLMGGGRRARLDLAQAEGW